MNETPHYVVVVHGIGEQRRGETVLPVVQRLAEARRAPHRRACGNPLTLPLLAGTRREHWNEFADIPRQRPVRPLDTPWVPCAAEPADGSNLRFVDLTWAEIPRRQFPAVGQAFAGWSAGLVERLTQRQQQDRSVAWVRDLLVHLRAGLVPVQAWLSLRARSASKLVFDDFLGDVQLYAEHAPTRGAAVRCFHDVMARLDQQHHGLRPRYTIIAHSLGTVLALDALAFAHSTRACRLGEAGAPLRLAGYEQPQQDVWPDPDRLPPVDWVHRVDHLVTLGSPIDKFLLLWPAAFSLYDDERWLDAAFVQRRPAPIRHLNYCDEQDPVGHELDLAHATPVVRKLFRLVEDRVYARYALPGVAHTGYWHDDDLFRRIVDIAVDGRSPDDSHRVAWFSNAAFFWVLVSTYVVVPATGWALATIACAWMLEAIGNEDATGTVVYLALCCVAVAATIWLGHLMVMWRQVLRLKRVRMVASPWRTMWRWLFWLMLWGTPPLWLWLALVCGGASDVWYAEPLPRAATVLATIVSSSLLGSYLIVCTNWRRLRRERAQARSGSA